MKLGDNPRVSFMDVSSLFIMNNILAIGPENGVIYSACCFNRIQIFQRLL